MWTVDNGQRTVDTLPNSFSFFIEDILNDFTLVLGCEQFRVKCKNIENCVSMCQNHTNIICFSVSVKWGCAQLMGTNRKKNLCRTIGMCGFIEIGIKMKSSN